MCIIVAHPTGTRLPTEDELQNCYDSNKNGAGIAFISPETGNVRIEKGFFKFEKFLKRYESLKLTKADPFLLHFRIATQGLVDKGNCHPFPITKRVTKLRATQIETDVAVTHNGVLWSNKDEKKLSDTMEYIRDFLAEDCIRRNLRNHIVEQLLLEYGGTYNKFAFLHAIDKEIVTFGKFEDEDGLMFSNKDYISYANYGAYGCGSRNWGSGLPTVYNKDDETKRVWCEFCGYTAIPEKVIKVADFKMCALCQNKSPDSEFITCKSCGVGRHKHALNVKDICIICDPNVQPEDGTAQDRKSETIANRTESQTIETSSDEIECEICGIEFPLEQLLDFGFDATSNTRLYMCDYCYDDIQQEEKSMKLEDEPLTAKDHEDDFSGPVGVA